jgi:glycosyltransferase involved in cell wall biosynthesis
VAKDYDVLFAGRIERRKGSRPMVLACQALVARRPDIRIAIVGYGDDDDHVRQALSPLAANVHLVGKLPFSQVIGYYRRSRVYASTSYYEGLPGTCLEAMATGLPVVAWDYLFYAGLVVGGGNGELVAVNDIPAFAGAVLALLDDEARRSRMGAEARAAVERGYAWAKLAPALLGVFDAARADGGTQRNRKTQAT